MNFLKPQTAITNLLLKVFLENKDKLIEKGVEAAVQYLLTIDVDENGKPDLEQLIEAALKIGELLLHINNKGNELVEKYGYKAEAGTVAMPKVELPK